MEPLPETLMLAESMRRLETATPPAPSSFESTTFIGRERELRDLAALASRERLVTISGEPGAGKSRLTLRHVRSVAAAHRDGAIIINVAGASDTEALRRALERALAGRAPSLPGDSAEELVAGLDAILYFDGCERCTRISRRHCVPRSAMSASQRREHAVASPRWATPSAGSRNTIWPAKPRRVRRI